MASPCPFRAADNTSQLSYIRNTCCFGQLSSSNFSQYPFENQKQPDSLWCKLRILSLYCSISVLSIQLFHIPNIRKDVKQAIRNPYYVNALWHIFWYLRAVLAHDILHYWSAWSDFCDQSHQRALFRKPEYKVKHQEPSCQPKAER